MSQFDYKLRHWTQAEKPNFQSCLRHWSHLDGFGQSLSVLETRQWQTIFENAMKWCRYKYKPPALGTYCSSKSFTLLQTPIEVPSETSVQEEFFSCTLVFRWIFGKAHLVGFQWWSFFLRITYWRFICLQHCQSFLQKTLKAEIFVSAFGPWGHALFWAFVPCLCFILYSFTLRASDISVILGGYNFD